MFVDVCQMCINLRKPVLLLMFVVVGSAGGGAVIVGVGDAEDIRCT